MCHWPRDVFRRWVKRELARFGREPRVVEPWAEAAHECLGFRASRMLGLQGFAADDWESRVYRALGLTVACMHKKPSAFLECPL